MATRNRNIHVQMPRSQNQPPNDNSKLEIGTKWATIFASLATVGTLIFSTCQFNKQFAQVNSQIEQAKTDRAEDKKQKILSDSSQDIKDSLSLNAITYQGKVAKSQYVLQKKLLDLQVVLDKGNIISTEKTIDRTFDDFKGFKKPIVTTFYKNIGKRNAFNFKITEYAVTSNFEYVSSNIGSFHSSDVIPPEGSGSFQHTFVLSASGVKNFYTVDIFEFKDEVIDTLLKNKFYFHYYGFNNEYEFRSCNIEEVHKIDSVLKANNKFH
ncbi:hypothetical protein QEG73_21900 [Chitinophagaceae bacterium 26-R-25]|nr:hypothetical protein [Chitinophagaceae bacterium 26-R-25]